MKKILSWREIIGRELRKMTFNITMVIFLLWVGIISWPSWTSFLLFGFIILGFWVTWSGLRRIKRTPITVCSQCEMELKKDWKSCPKCLIEIKEEK